MREVGDLVGLSEGGVGREETRATDGRLSHSRAHADLTHLGCERCVGEVRARVEMRTGCRRSSRRQRASESADRRGTAARRRGEHTATALLQGKHIPHARANGGERKRRGGQRESEEKTLQIAGKCLPRRDIPVDPGQSRTITYTPRNYTPRRADRRPTRSSRLSTDSLPVRLVDRSGSSPTLASAPTSCRLGTTLLFCRPGDPSPGAAKLAPLGPGEVVAAA